MFYCGLPPGMRHRFAEVFVMLAYFFNSRGRRQKRIIDMHLLKGSLTGPVMGATAKAGK